MLDHCLYTNVIVQKTYQTFIPLKIKHKFFFSFFFWFFPFFSDFFWFFLIFPKFCLNISDYVSFSLNISDYVSFYLNLSDYMSFGVFILWFYIIMQKIISNGRTVLEIFKFQFFDPRFLPPGARLGPFWAQMPKFGPNGIFFRKIPKVTFLRFWIHDSIEKISQTGRTVLEIFQFEESSDLIGREPKSK